MSRLAKGCTPASLTQWLNYTDHDPANSTLAPVQLDEGTGTPMDVYNQVRATYVDKVDDNILIKGRDRRNARRARPAFVDGEGPTTPRSRPPPRGNYGGLGLSVTMEDGAVKVITPTRYPGDMAGMKAGDYTLPTSTGELLTGFGRRRAVGGAVRSRC
jgi:carboxyl-terminal processing protease